MTLSFGTRIIHPLFRIQHGIFNIKKSCFSHTPAAVKVAAILYEVKHLQK